MQFQGGIVTNLGRHDRPRYRMDDEADGKQAGGQGLKTIPQGAATTCWAATSVDLSEQAVYTARIVRLLKLTTKLRMVV